MDPHERLFRRSLKDVLVAQGTLTPDQAEELTVSAKEGHEPLAAVLVSSGYMSSWDLAKTVAANYQLPVLPLAGFTFDRELLEGLAPAVLYEHLVLPVGRFGRAFSFAVIEPPSRDLIESLRTACGSSIFFFVGEVTEVQRHLREHVKVVDAANDASWQAIFDTGDQAVLEENQKGS